jgi:hypothetical protein
LATKVFVDSSGTVITGTMPNIGAQNISILTPTEDNSKMEATIAKGYHSGDGKVSLEIVTESVTPTKS